MTKKPIIITGAARSGTSLVAGLVDKCGVFGGDASLVCKWNPKGMFENTRLRQKVVKPYLRRLQVDPLGQFPLPEVQNLLPFPDMKKQIENELKRDGWDGKRRWYYKCAKACLFWPIWLKAFPKAQWVIVRRRKEQIAESCLRTSFMRKFGSRDVRKRNGFKSEYDSWLWWVEQHEQRFQEMIEAGMDVRMVWTEKIVAGDFEELDRVMNWLRLEMTQEARSLITPEIWGTDKRSASACKGGR